MIPEHVAVGQQPATAEQAKEHKLTDAEWNTLQAGLDHAPTLLELGVVSALWSEHCSYKSSKRFLVGFPTDGPRVLQGPGENAGVVDIGNGWAVAFKMESHNHPSFIEPYQGAATGVGGIMRDVFTMGARPIASMNALRFGEPYCDKTGTRTKSLVHGVVAGIGGYGNCMGVPTVGGETYFHESYNGNNLVNAFNLGLLKSDAIFRGAAAGIGNPVLYVGSKTGRDGIHGASMASDSFSEDDAADQRPTVQAGDPFQEKKLLEACLELMQTDTIIGIQDMGAAGLTSSAFEMAERAGTALRMDLDKVPMREEAMTPYELMLSESQERMLVVLKEGCEDKVYEIFERWGLDAVVIGQVLEGSGVQLYWAGEHLTTIPVDLAVSGYSEAPHTLAEPIVALGEPDVPEVDDWSDFLQAWLSHPNIASKRWVYEQYDSTVQGQTVAGPGAEAAVVQPPQIAPKAVAMTSDCPSRYVQVDPANGGQHAVAQGMRNLACVGAEPIGLTDCLNFGSPEDPAVYRTFADAIGGVSSAATTLNIPVVSGNVSLYNSTDGVAVLPTPELGIVGLIENLAPPAEPVFVGDSIVLVGEHHPVFGGSEYAYRCGDAKGALPALNLQLEEQCASFVRDIVANRSVKDAKDIGTGGLLTGLMQLAFRHNVLGLTVNDASAADDATRYYLGESSAAYVLVCSADQLNVVLQAAEKSNVAARVVGQISASYKLAGIDEELPSPQALYDIYFNAFETWVNDA